MVDLPCYHHVHSLHGNPYLIVATQARRYLIKGICYHLNFTEGQRRIAAKAQQPCPLGRPNAWFHQGESKRCRKLHSFTLASTIRLFILIHSTAIVSICKKI